ncbi:MAG: acyloxyacyl hydrolase [Bacteroidota bacterium]
MIRRILFLTILLFSITRYENFVSAQKVEHENLFLESKFQYGFIWQHRPTIKDIIGGNIKVFDISIGKQTYGQKYWEQLYRYPNYGFGYYFIDLGNPEELGQANALFAYVDIPVLRRGKHLLSYRISEGLAYLNQGNIAIGSHLNLYFDLTINYRYRLSEHLDLINGFGATHFSNGAIKMPNLGVNLFSYRLGLHYRFKTPVREFVKLELPVIEKKNSISFFLATGVKEKRPEGGIPYNVMTFSVDYLRLINLKHKVGLGFDTFYDESLFETMNPDSSLYINNSDIMRYGVHLAFEAELNKIMWVIHLGTYIRARYKEDGAIYQKVGIRYLISKNLYANISLKTSKGVADYTEFGFGYRFYWK